MQAGTWGVLSVADALIARGVTERVDLGFFPYTSSHRVVLSKAGLGELTEQGPNPRCRLWIATPRVCMYVYMHICIYLYNRCAPSACCCFFFGGKTVKFGSTYCCELSARGAEGVSFVCPELCFLLSAAGGRTQTRSVRINDR